MFLGSFQFYGLQCNLDPLKSRSKYHILVRILIHCQRDISCFIHPQTHSETGNKNKKKNHFHHKEHHFESQGDGNTSCVVHLDLLAGDDQGSTVALVQGILQRAMILDPDKSALTILCVMFVGKIKKRESSATLL